MGRWTRGEEEDAGIGERQLVLFADLGFHRVSKRRLQRRARWQSLSVGPICAWPHSSSTKIAKVQVTNKVTDPTAMVKSGTKFFYCGLDPTLEQHGASADSVKRRVV
jgi:hypothetical protein